jgi:hypothetical protein
MYHPNNVSRRIRNRCTSPFKYWMSIRLHQAYQDKLRSYPPAVEGWRGNEDPALPQLLLEMRYDLGAIDRWEKRARGIPLTEEDIAHISDWERRHFALNESDTE